MNKVKISFGGSHRKNRRCVNAMMPFMVDVSLILPHFRSKVLEGTAIDSAEIRVMLKTIGGTVCRNQPAYLKESQ